MDPSDPNEKRYRVRVEGLNLELVCAGSSVEEFLEFESASKRAAAEGRRRIVDVAGLMEPKVVSWNRSEPFSLRMMLSKYDFPDLEKILIAYSAAVVGVADPLDPPSFAGEQSAGESDPRMEQSLASLSS